MIHLKRSLSLALLISGICSAGAMAQSATTAKTGSFIPQQTPHVYRNMSRGMAITTYEPQLQGATMGTIGPQANDQTMISGLMTAGTVTVTSHADLEAALNLVALLALVFGHLSGIYYLVKTIRLTVKTPGNVLGGLAKGFTFIGVGLLSPTFINWALESCRDAAIF
jgi:hypothetical protein